MNPVFIMKLPGGYDYHVMERGATLSLGQRQLLSFVRALLYDPAILILDETTGAIFDTNPFIQKLLGYSQTELVGKQLWQIGFFRDIEENKIAFRELQTQGYIRYEHLPLETKSGQREEAAWQGLVKVYETMKPREAAAIFNDLAMPVLISVLDRMKETKAAAVLAAMAPDRARDVTTQLALTRTEKSDKSDCQQQAGKCEKDVKNIPREKFIDKTAVKSGNRPDDRTEDRRDHDDRDSNFE